MYLDEKIQTCTCPKRLTQLCVYKQEIENDQLTTDMLLYQPRKSTCDWDENTWTRRLANGLKLLEGYNKTRFTAQGNFSDLQCEHH